MANAINSYYNDGSVKKLKKFAQMVFYTADPNILTYFPQEVQDRILTSGKTPSALWDLRRFIDDILIKNFEILHADPMSTNILFPDQVRQEVLEYEELVKKSKVFFLPNVAEELEALLLKAKDTGVLQEVIHAIDLGKKENEMLLNEMMEFLKKEGNEPTIDLT